LPRNPYFSSGLQADSAALPPAARSLFESIEECRRKTGISHWVQ
jgi:hypothetical protein